LGYPNAADEKQILINLRREHPITHLKQVVDGEALLAMQEQVWDIHVDDTLQDYIVALSAATRSHKDLALGVSPRGSLALFKASQAFAAIQGRDYVLPDDIKALAPLTLAHRLIVKPDAELRGYTAETILTEVMETTPLDLGQVTDT
jgi:MoxR-like ATPase